MDFRKSASSFQKTVYPLSIFGRDVATRSVPPVLSRNSIFIRDGESDAKDVGEITGPFRGPGSHSSESHHRNSVR